MTVISTRLMRASGIRYFHSSFRIWSIRRRGKVHLIHISNQTSRKADRGCSGSPQKYIAVYDKII